MWKLNVILVLVTLGAKSVIGANILYLASMASPSHHIWNRVLAFELAQRGHNVTHVGPDQDKLPKPQNYTHILLEGIYDIMHDNFDINDMSTLGPLQMLNIFEEWCMIQCDHSLKTKGVQTLLNYPPEFKFDLVITDITCGSCLNPFIHRFKYPPAVAVTPFLLPVYVSYNFGNHLFPSYMPYYALPYTTDMDFMERVWNFLFTYLDIISKHFKFNKEWKAAKSIFGNDIPPTVELERHISLVLSNTDPILDYPQPVPPNIIPVGGLHTKRSKEISSEFINILDNAKNGVILFSLGTNIRSDKLGSTTIRAITDAFSKLSQTVIWKFESENENLPKNVIVKKWLPQNDILGHPNVKLFIGHGGTLSTQESLFHGIPIVAVPFIVDQYINARNLENRKLGVYVDYKNITTQSYFLNKIREVLDNPVYAKNAQKISTIFKDKKETPLERGIFWIEYVLRHGGADFLNTAARDLPFYKAFSLDVLAFAIVLVVIIVSISAILIKLILNLFNKKIKIKTQ